MQSLTLRDSKSFGDCLSLSNNPVDDAAAWMQNRLDGSCHPALNTDDPNVFYDKGKEEFSLLRDLSGQTCNSPIETMLLYNDGCL